MTVSQPELLGLVVDRTPRPQVREHFALVEENDDVHR
jgi:hypothetical protein